MSFFHQRQHAATEAFAITEDDDVVISPPTRGIYIGGAGNLVAVLAGDTEPQTFTAIAVGVVHPLQVKKVMEASTCSLIIGVR